MRTTAPIHQRWSTWNSEHIPSEQRTRLEVEITESVEHALQNRTRKGKAVELNTALRQWAYEFPGSMLRWRLVNERTFTRPSCLGCGALLSDPVVVRGFYHFVEWQDGIEETDRCGRCVMRACESHPPEALQTFKQYWKRVARHYYRFVDCVPLLIATTWWLTTNYDSQFDPVRSVRWKTVDRIRKKMLAKGVIRFRDLEWVQPLLTRRINPPPEIPVTEANRAFMEMLSALTVEQKMGAMSVPEALTVQKMYWMLAQGKIPNHYVFRRLVLLYHKYVLNDVRPDGVGLRRQEYESIFGPPR